MQNVQEHAWTSRMFNKMPSCDVDTWRMHKLCMGMVRIHLIFLNTCMKKVCSFAFFQLVAM
jgi:hypothetical protein